MSNGVKKCLSLLLAVAMMFSCLMLPAYGDGEQERLSLGFTEGEWVETNGSFFYTVGITVTGERDTFELGTLQFSVGFNRNPVEGETAVLNIRSASHNIPDTTTYDEDGFETGTSSMSLQSINYSEANERGYVNIALSDSVNHVVTNGQTIVSLRFKLGDDSLKNESAELYFDVEGRDTTFNYREGSGSSGRVNYDVDISATKTVPAIESNSTFTVEVIGGTSDSSDYNEGDTVTITATIPEGHQFLSWTSDDGVTFADATAATTTFIMLGKNVTVTANTETIPSPDYTVTVNGGTADQDKYKEGDTVTITVSVPSGEMFVNWTSDDGVTFADATAATTTFVMPGKNVTVTANTEAIPIPDYTVTVNGGTADQDKYKEGDTVTITASVPSGEMFVNWTTDDGVTFANATAATTTFVMPGKNVTVTANTEAIPIPDYTVTVNGGTADQSKYKEGDTVTITASVPSGKSFVNWTSNDGVTFANATATTTTFVMPGKNVTVTANTETIPTPDYTVTVNGGTADQTKYKEGDTVTITASVPSGEMFVNWTTDDGVTFGNATAATTTFVMPGKNVTVTANSETVPIPEYRVTVIGGTADKDSYKEGETVYVTATTPENYRFIGWYSVDNVLFEDEQQESTSFSMPGSDVTVQANFEEVEPGKYTVTVSGPDGVTGGGQYSEGETVRITAPTSNNGDPFFKWTWTGPTDFSIENATSNETTFTMPGGPVSVKATYDGCYVATAVYGSYDCPEVWTLRRFRDRILAKSWYGRLFIHLYYAVSPTAVKLFGDTKWFQDFFRGRLDKMVSNLQSQGFESTPYQDRAW